jgi:(2R)-sulfolactate sulfo-lyase subunit beta
MHATPLGSLLSRASPLAKDFLQTASELGREQCPISDLWVSHKCGESDTTSGMGANPAVGNFIDKTDAVGVTNCFGET